MGLFDKKSRTTNTNNERNSSSVDNRIFEGGASIVGGNLTLSGDGNTITDGGAIAGNIAVANNALRTAETITGQLGDQFNSGLQSISGLSGRFSTALESIKKAEVTNGKSLTADLLRWWPIVPISLVAALAIKSREKSGG